MPGDEAFKLYDTFGLPLDFIEDLASERRLAFDREGFDRAMEVQRGKARAKSGFDQKRSHEFTFTSDAAREALRSAGDVFEGYTSTTVNDAHVLAVFDADRRRSGERSAAATEGYVVLDRTPFYVEAGGQVSDVGELRDANGAFLARVEGVARLGTGPAARAPRARRCRRGAHRQPRHRRGRPMPCATPHAATTRPRTCCTRRCGRCSGRT